MRKLSETDAENKADLNARAKLSEEPSKEADADLKTDSDAES
jgi:hypothetical protein